MALIPWSPLARGLLSGKKGTVRSENDANIKNLFGKPAQKEMVGLFYTQGDEKINQLTCCLQEETVIARVVEVAGKRGVSPSQIAIAWQFSKGVTSPIVGKSKMSSTLLGPCNISSRFHLTIGINKPEYLDDAIAASKLTLTKEEIAYLEEPYIPRPAAGMLPLPTDN